MSGCASALLSSCAACASSSDLNPAQQIRLYAEMTPHAFTKKRKDSHKLSTIIEMLSLQANCGDEHKHLCLEQAKHLHTAEAQWEERRFTMHQQQMQMIIMCMMRMSSGPSTMPGIMAGALPMPSNTRSTYGNGSGNPKDDANY